MGKLRKKIVKSISRQLRNEGLPMIHSALLTGFRTAGKELSDSPDLRTAAPDLLFRGIAGAFRNGLLSAGKELAANVLDYVRSDRIDVQPPSGLSESGGFGTEADEDEAPEHR